MATTPVPIKSLPGIKRDGTELEGSHYVDGQWVRFQRGLPRKMRGYKSVSRNLTDRVQTLHTQVKDSYEYIHCGGPSSLERVLYSPSLNTSTVVDRTPSGVTSSPQNLWHFQSIFDSTSSNILLMALLTNGPINSTSTAGTLYSGDVYATADLTSVTGCTVSGGILALPPYLIAYGSDGYVQWTAPNFPTDFAGSGSGEARVTSQKILKGLPLRGGGGYSPACLLWSVDSLIRMMFTGGDTYWQWDTLSSQISVMSPNAIVEVDGVYYWPGTDRFLMFNGVVREIPNQLNFNWFFDNVRSGDKCFALKNPRWGEIWWCFPKSPSDECTHALIYNYREDTWYDTLLPNGGRGAGVNYGSSTGILMAGNQTNTLSKYTLWAHETGTDEVEAGTTRAIQSYFETADLFLADSEKPISKGIHIDFLEPDFIQSGDMTVSVKTRPNSRASYNVVETKTFSDTAATAYDQVVPLKTTGRQLRLKFESNVAGGDYEMGLVIGHVSPSIGKIL